MFIVNDGEEEKPHRGGMSVFGAAPNRAGNLLLFDTYKHAAPLGLSHSQRAQKKLKISSCVLF
jgi:hypothetical protein